MKNINFSIDVDTEFLFKIISMYLREYFGYIEDELIVEAINSFYLKMKKSLQYLDERDFMNLNFHHDHPFLVAGKIHYHNSLVLQKQYCDVVSWLRAIDLFTIPDEAMEDYRKWLKNMGNSPEREE